MTEKLLNKHFHLVSPCDLDLWPTYPNIYTCIAVLQVIIYHLAKYEKDPMKNDREIGGRRWWERRKIKRKKRHYNNRKVFRRCRQTLIKCFNFLSSFSISLPNRSRRWDPRIIERTIGVVLGHSVLRERFLTSCILHSVPQAVREGISWGASQNLCRGDKDRRFVISDCRGLKGIIERTICLVLIICKIFL